MRQFAFATTALIVKSSRLELIYSSVKWQSDKCLQAVNTAVTQGIQRAQSLSQYRARQCVDEVSIFRRSYYKANEKIRRRKILTSPDYRKAEFSEPMILECKAQLKVIILPHNGQRRVNKPRRRRALSVGKSGLPFRCCQQLFLVLIDCNSRTSNACGVRRCQVLALVLPEEVSFRVCKALSL